MWIIKNDVCTLSFFSLLYVVLASFLFLSFIFLSFFSLSSLFFFSHFHCLTSTLTTFFLSSFISHNTDTHTHSHTLSLPHGTHPPFYSFTFFTHIFPCTSASPSPSLYSLGLVRNLAVHLRTIILQQLC